MAGVRGAARRCHHVESPARRTAGQLGIDTVIAEVLPGDRAAQIATLRHDGHQIAMADGDTDASALAVLGIEAGTDVAVEAAVVLMRPTCST
jgi:P-type Cu2+ transporter